MGDAGSPFAAGRGIGVAVVGFGWMGRVHTQAYSRVHHHFPHTPRPRLVAVADDVPGRAEEAAEWYGFDRAETDWRALLDDRRGGGEHHRAELPPS